MMVQMSPDSKDAYGKAKKEDRPTEEKPTQHQAAANSCISFPDVGGNRFEFFNTHVKPGTLNIKAGNLSITHAHVFVPHG